MLCFPNAKINIGLRVLRRRADGYHEIETLFYPVPLRDALEAVPAATTAFHLSGLLLPDVAPEENLVWKALKLLEQTYTLPPLAIYLRKHIPFGAGLGGGSADAAFMLKLLNACAALRLSDTELEALATTLGADCPFFIRNRPVLATGIGNRFEPVDLSLKGYTLWIVKPDVAVSTKEAYSWVKPSVPSVSLKELSARPVAEWKHGPVNDFEQSVCRRYPVIGAVKAQLYAQGAAYAAMSGSGSSVYGLFDKDVQMHFPGCFVWKGKLD
ncbi:MAG: 4-(cytidine 5'-diphospho)-2-C-methyl-D-erythritol kinase [Tannerella sp.]|jgi:4-diphosphocytidyl-2-C-methyl-D-erythritol kinase|nr:4-(cytidine 5'-diphospho)-2-C-methyl-D-erythritol kinase [Tannerella sp.]